MGLFFSNPYPMPGINLQIYLGWVKKSDWEKEKAKSFFKSEWQGLYAVHVDVEMSMALCMKSLIKKALKSPSMKAYTNLPFLLVPVLAYKTPQSNRDDIDHACTQHNLHKKLWQNTSRPRFALWAIHWF